MSQVDKNTANPKFSRKEQQVHGVLDGLKEVFHQRLSDVNSSKQFFNAGISDQLAQYIGKYIDEPLTIVSHGLNDHYETIRDLLESYLEKELFQCVDTDGRIIRTNNEGNLLHYCIILEKDTLKNRRPFFNFLKSYDNYQLSNQFPILFDFVSSKFESSLNNVKEFKLNEGLSKKGEA